MSGGEIAMLLKVSQRIKESEQTISSDAQIHTKTVGE